MPRFDRCNKGQIVEQAADLDFACPFVRSRVLVARSDSFFAPEPFCVTIQHEYAFPCRHNDLVATIAVHVDELEIMGRMERRVGDLNGPRLVSGHAWNIMNDHANPLPFPPVRTLGSTPLQGSNHELLSPRAFHVAEPQPVQRGLFE